VDEPDGYDLDPWLTRFDGYTQQTLAGLEADGLAHYDQAREVWVITGAGEAFEVRNVDTPAHGHAEPGDTSGPPIDALIDQAIIRFDTGQAPDGPLDSLIYRALRDADSAAGEGTTTGWRDELIRRIAESGPLEWYEITYADADPLNRLPVRSFDDEAARRAAARMSRTGGPVDVTYVTGRGRRLIASYVNGQLLTGTPAEPFAVPPPRPATLVPAASDAARPPRPAAPGGTRGTPDQFPHGITPLDAPMPSGGRVRPGRLLYPDGTPVDVRPIGSSRTIPAVAAGAVPADGDLAPGWLQVIDLGNGDLQKVHPALITPRGVRPLDWLPIRQIRRFGEFDSAEATGRDSAMLPATLIDPGDHIRTAAGEVREVVAQTDLGPESVKIATNGPGGPDSGQQYTRWATVEVIIPARHPAQDSPAAGQLFADTPPPGRRAGASAADGQAFAAPARPDELTGLQEALEWIRRDGAAAPRHGVPPIPGAGSGPAPISLDEALGRRGGRHRLPAAAAMPDQAGWRVSVTMTGTMHRAQGEAAAQIGSLAQDPEWRRLRGLTTRARRLAADASAGRVQFADPAWALRSWRAVWARVCEITGDLAARLMTDWTRGPAGHHKGSRAWQAARDLHHVACQGAAHAYGWLPRGMRLPAGSYEPPGGRRVTAATARVKALNAARLHDQAAGPPGRFDFPADLSLAAPRNGAGRRDQQPAARAASSRDRRGTALPRRPGPR
jgi:hypothetical protein